MRKLNKYTVLLVASILLCSCDSFMDVHKDFIADGEIMYAPKVDSMAVYSGKDRAKLKLWLYNATFVESVHIYWNSNLDSLVVPASFNPGMDSMDIIIPNLKENAYTFDVQTKDTRKVLSLKTTGFGSAYGAAFQSSLSGRSVKSAAVSNGNGEVLWNSADEKLFCTEVKYTRTTGEEVVVRSGQEDTKTICQQANASKGFTHRSLFLPDIMAIDTFYTEWSENIKFPVILDRTNWEIIFATTQVSGSYPAKAMIDGNMNSFWHSDWNVLPPFPYLIVIDMKENALLSMVDIYRRVGNTDSKSLRIYVSEDNEHWTACGSFTFGGPSMICQFEKPVLGRYVKLEFYESNKTDRSTSIAEVYAIGVKD